MQKRAYIRNDEKQYWRLQHRARTKKMKYTGTKLNKRHRAHEN